MPTSVLQMGWQRYYIFHQSSFGQRRLKKCCCPATSFVLSLMRHTAFLHGGRIFALIIFISATLSANCRSRRVIRGQFLCRALLLQPSKRSSVISATISNASLTSTLNCLHLRQHARISTMLCYLRKQKRKSIQRFAL